MQRDAEATRKRLIAAGRAEFAAYGITGARVDRIAASAQSNKAQIHHYFTNKAGLFDAVWSDLVRQIVDGLPLDVADLPGLAVMLCDTYAEHPELPRLITWQRLERGEATPNEIATGDSRKRVKLIAQALADGTIASRFPADALFAGVDGLDVIRRLLGQVAGVSVVALEIGFDQADAPLSIHHYCFRVDDATFDRILEKLAALGIN